MNQCCLANYVPINDVISLTNEICTNNIMKKMHWLHIYVCRIVISIFGWPQRLPVIFLSFFSLIVWMENDHQKVWTFGQTRQKPLRFLSFLSKALRETIWVIETKFLFQSCFLNFRVMTFILCFSFSLWNEDGFFCYLMWFSRNWFVFSGKSLLLG